ncbi:L,D-transpeptidase [Dolichospermum planctonicum CS-1226]|uniref:L,D-transpeptidase n=1 Tax=Dolichospermum planctonicum CS-1226 TaxID=3021751 RepID=A0ABT5AJR5_9CYAN|nr:L,D-transpeptidase [Dolichospermum planctonicum]MDB9537114.1 L,D-transpeptidase [Dolichospermum planctonicum CS-1226]
MAMARNESVATMVMFLCFGTAILSLAVHLQTMKKTEVGELNYSRSTEIYPQDSPVTGSSAIAASVPTSPQKAGTINLDSDQKQPQSSFASIASTINNTSPPVSASDTTQVVVDLSDRRVYVFRYDEVIASYPIAIGKKGWETPTGNFKVIHKEHHPIWRHPITGAIFDGGTNSPLGDRWIGFWSDGRNEIGFHGTPDVDLVGAAVSHGCLRMRNPDVRMLYSQVSLNTPVLVRD